MNNLLLINVDELWLKGGNRPRYFKMLKKHIKNVFKGMDVPQPFEIKMENQRLIATTEGKFDTAVIHKLTEVAGIHSIIPATKVESDMDEIVRVAIELMKPFTDTKTTFRVNTKRVNKFFPKTSMETSAWVGHKILDECSNTIVKLKNPDVVVDVKVQNEYSYISNQKFMALGGLPVSSSGHVLSLLSGGFDSPVASYLMAKRGCSMDFAFFYSYPFVGEEVKDKILELSKTLAGFQNGCRLFVIPFGDVQKEISDKCRESYSTILFRKMMVETSTLLATKTRAKGLVTGDSLGQVSSQTLENIAAIDSIATVPILRPLIGMNKKEIIKISEKIGTHDTSIIPHDDACSLFAPAAPVIKTDLIYWRRFSQEHDFSALLNKAVDEAEIYKFSAMGEIL